MWKFNKILNGLIKALVVVVGLAIAVVPIIYIFAHEPQTTLPWREELGKFADRTDQLALLSLSPISNFYLRPQKSKLSWSDVNATLQLADYLQHYVQSRGFSVIRRLVEFKKPSAKKGKGTGQSQGWFLDALEQVSQLQEKAPLRWLRDIVQPYLSFEHDSLKHKHWIIVCLGDLDPKHADVIKALQEAQPGHRFILVSPWPVSSKFVQIASLPAAPQPQNVVEAEEDTTGQQPTFKNADNTKKPNKSKKKYVVKQLVKQQNISSMANTTKSQEQL